MLELDYEIGELTRINVGIYDEIRKAKVNKPMGSCLFEVGEVLGSRGNLKAKKLRQGGGTVFCRITAAPPAADAGRLQLQLRGSHLKNVDGLFSKSDPFVEISAQVNVPSGLTWQPIYRSKPIMNDLNPIWPPLELDLNRCTTNNNDNNNNSTPVDPTTLPLLVQVYDWEKSGKHKTLGQCETTVQALLDAQTPGGSASNPKSVDTSKALELRNPRSKQKNKVLGKLVVCRAVLEGGHEPAAPATTTTAIPMAVPTNTTSSTPPTFVDYLTGGCELELSIAIDFTGSNGDPRRPGTLHYISHHSNDLNDYEKAFLGVGSIVARYDSDQRFPIYGFGAKFHGRINHCFQVGSQPEVAGLGQALQAYRNVFSSGLTMSGPTVFAEVIDLAAARARSALEDAQRVGKQTYSILLILTDGAVSDIALTQRALLQASNAPLSIVIVGVGQANFDKMQFLDDVADRNPEQRDICQFVEFQKYANDKSALTRETLAEIPSQVVDYFYNLRGISPLPPVHGSQVSLLVADDYNEEEDIDLTIAYNSEDEIVLDGSLSALPTYDDTQYPTASVYLMPPVPVPVAASATAPPMTADPPGSVPPQPPQIHTNAYATAVPVMPPPVQPSYLTASSSYLSSTVPAATVDYHSSSVSRVPPATAAAAKPKVFHVQVPPGVTAGQQLEIQHPHSRQHLIVTVPPGVTAGGKFAVPY